MMYDEAILKLLDQGLTSYGLGNLEEALAAWRRVLELDPTNARARDYIIFIEKHWASTPLSTPSTKQPDVAEETAPAAYTHPAKSIFQSAHWGDIYEGQSIGSSVVEALMPSQPPPSPVPTPQPEILTSTLPPKPGVRSMAQPNVPGTLSALELVAVETPPAPQESHQNQQSSEPLLESCPGSYGSQ